MSTRVGMCGNVQGASFGCPFVWEQCFFLASMCQQQKPGGWGIEIGNGEGESEEKGEKKEMKQRAKSNWVFWTLL